MSERVIIKLQLSLSTMGVGRQVLIYNEDRSIMEQFDASQEVLDLMGDEVKAYFYAKLIPDPNASEGSLVRLDEFYAWELDW